MSLTLAKPQQQRSPERRARIGAEKPSGDSASRVAAADVETAASGGLPLFLQNDDGKLSRQLPAELAHEV